MTERALRWLALGLSVAVVFAASHAYAGPASSGRPHHAEAYMVDLVNAARAEHGLPPFDVAADVAEVAYAWSVTMATTRVFEHNTGHPGQICCWATVAENIAMSDPVPLWRPGDEVARTTRELHEALLASPGHRANILADDMDQIGVGIHVDGQGTIWITQNFRRHLPRG